MKEDERMMLLALALARRGEGRVEPNPMVGCVIVRRGRVIGEGYHRRFGGRHAEIEALRWCATTARGATVYVTLEPCCHFGKTPPCTDALIQAGVAEVVIPLADPDPLVGGKGIRQLRRAGIRVRTGVCRGEAEEVLAPYLTCTRLDRPYVIAKWAQGLDGGLVTAPGTSKWISSEASRRRVHRLRARVDAVLVGVGTVQADDPLLNARGVPVRRLAARVVLDSRLRIPEFCRLAATARAIPLWLVTSPRAARTAKAMRLKRRGAEIIGCAGRDGRVSLKQVLRELHHRGVTNLIVEGGPTVLTSFLQARLVDECLGFVAPRIVGDAKAKRGLETRLQPRAVTVERSGDDAFFRCRLTEPP